MSEQYIFNRNELPYGPSPMVHKTIRRIKAGQLTQYTHGYNNSVLVDFLSTKYDLPKEQIIVEHGAQNILKLVFDCLPVNTRGVLTSTHHYSFYDKYTEHKKIKLYTFPLIKTEKSFVFDVHEIKERYKEYEPGCVLITSPNNWTGNSISSSDFEELLASVNPGTLVILDQAYFGFTKDFEDEDLKIADLVKRYPNLIIIRTMSKLYGLAGMRVGFALCGSVAVKIINHFGHDLGFNRISEVATIAAIQDKKYYKKISKRIIDDREYLISELNKLDGVKVYLSDSNFVLMEIDESLASRIYEVLSKQKVVLSKYMGQGFFRITVSTRRHIKAFLKCMRMAFNVYQPRF